LAAFPLARADVTPHLAEETVAVEVLARIFVEQAVTIRVEWPHRASQGLGRQ